MADVYSFVSSNGKTGDGESLWEAVTRAIPLPENTKIAIAKVEIDIPSTTEIGNSHTRRGGLIFNLDGSWIGAFIVE